MAERFCIYTAGSGLKVRARVIAGHRNGWMTVEPWFFQAAGKDVGLMIGGRVVLRVADLDVRPANMREYWGDGVAA